MGTRGFLYVRCRGRYFVYYNHFDCYPEGLGQAIIQEIPEDLVNYRRKINIALSVKGDQPESTSSLPERYTKSYLAVDDHLEGPPLRALLPDVVILFIEWTYTLDLDREILTVDNSIHYKLSNIPHSGRWIKYIGSDAHRRRAFRTGTPDDIISNIAWLPEVKETSKSGYKALNIETVSPKALVSYSTEVFAHRESLLWTIYSLAHEQSCGLLDQFFLDWKPSDFLFREMAFAFLSIAA
ncbi:hypothetical protein EYZ11_001592 [Aspergillus tanneri]|uniref:Uncharacterized protein n=1 Tax=Aspergillus tanneri TaxID=1220188 RepID=A0A4S3JTA4_9EURO|nr:hypothetical protein EYZ11_001592 [Aspergillus tanneri]